MSLHKTFARSIFLDWNYKHTYPSKNSSPIGSAMIHGVNIAQWLISVHFLEGSVQPVKTYSRASIEDKDQIGLSRGSFFGRVTQLLCLAGAGIFVGKNAKANKWVLLPVAGLLAVKWVSNMYFAKDTTLDYPDTSFDEVFATIKDVNVQDVNKQPLIRRMLELPAAQKNPGEKLQFLKQYLANYPINEVDSVGDSILSYTSMRLVDLDLFKEVLSHKPDLQMVYSVDGSSKTILELLATYGLHRFVDALLKQSNHLFSKEEKQKALALATDHFVELKTMPKSEVNQQLTQQLLA